MFEQLMVTVELTEQKEETSSIKHEVTNHVIDNPQDWNDLMEKLEKELRFATNERPWPNNMFEPDKFTRKVLDRKDNTIIIQPYVGTINIKINYSRKGWNC